MKCKEPGCPGEIDFRRSVLRLYGPGNRFKQHLYLCDVRSCGRLHDTHGHLVNGPKQERIFVRGSKVIFLDDQGHPVWSPKVSSMTIKLVAY